MKKILLLMGILVFFSLNVNSAKAVSEYAFGDIGFVILNDTITPFITIISPQNITYKVMVIDLKVIANETIDTWKYQLNGGTNITFTPNTTINAIMGSNYIIVWANDTQGNINFSQVYFTRIPSAPSRITPTYDLTDSLTRLLYFIRDLYISRDLYVERDVSLLNITNCNQLGTDSEGHVVCKA